MVFDFHSNSFKGEGGGGFGGGRLFGGWGIDMTLEYADLQRHTRNTSSDAAFLPRSLRLFANPVVDGG